MYSVIANACASRSAVGCLHEMGLVSVFQSATVFKYSFELVPSSFSFVFHEFSFHCMLKSMIRSITGGSAAETLFAYMFV